MFRLAVLCVCVVLTITPLAAQQAAIRARGIIESTETGFRFPDGTVQGTAATVTGGVPSVNGIPGAVTVVGSGLTSVSTANGTVTVTTASPYKNTRIVSPVPNNTLASGTALLNALNGITDASATKRYLIAIEPGIYDLGTNQLVMKPAVDIAGAGPGSTLILTARTGGLGDDGFPTIAGVVAATSSELRDLTIFNTANNWLGAALMIKNVRLFRVSNVKLRSKGTYQGGRIWGIHLRDADLDAFRLEVSASEGTPSEARGIEILGSADVSMVHGRITVDGGGNAPYSEGISIRGFSGTNPTVVIDSSTVIARGATVTNTGILTTSAQATVTNSTIEVDGGQGRTAVVASELGTRMDLRHCFIKAGNVWTPGGARSAARVDFAGLRFYASTLDSQSSGTPGCYGSFYTTGLLASDCSKVP